MLFVYQCIIDIDTKNILRFGPPSLGRHMIPWKLPERRKAD